MGKVLTFKKTGTQSPLTLRAVYSAAGCQPPTTGAFTSDVIILETVAETD